MAARRRDSVDAALRRVALAAEHPHVPESRLALEAAIDDAHWLVVSEAAAVVGEHGLSDFEERLKVVWSRFADKGPKADPGCRAKEATLTALDRLEIWDPDPFLVAIRHRQWEPVAAGRVDTAGGVRQRALFALLRMHHSHACLYAGELFADDNPQVRAAAAQALGHYGDERCAGLLTHRLCAGDPEPTVLLEAGSALLEVSPAFALELLLPRLRDDDEVRRETTALALGQSARPEAVRGLVDWIDAGLIDTDFELAVRALGLSRQELARTTLLDVVREGSTKKAKLAVEALAIHRYDSELAQRVREAAKQNPEGALSRFADRLFG